MADQISLTPQRVLDANGDPAAGAKAYFYASGTTNPVTVYADEDKTTAHPTPLVADAQGVFPQVWLANSSPVKVNVTAADDTVLNGYPIDPAIQTSVTSSGAAGISFTPITGNSANDVQEAIENNTAALDGKAPKTRAISAGSGMTGGGDLSNDRTIGLDIATQAEAEAGTDNLKPMTALRVKQAIDNDKPATFSAETTPIPAANSVTSHAHGLGAIPSDYEVVAVCTTDDNAWVAGDEIKLATNGVFGSFGNAITANATHIKLVYRSLQMVSGDASSYFVIDGSSNWKLVFRATA